MEPVRGDWLVRGPFATHLNNSLGRQGNRFDQNILYNVLQSCTHTQCYQLLNCVTAESEQVAGEIESNTGPVDPEVSKRIRKRVRPRMGS
jgi:hypothetical protein